MINNSVRLFGRLGQDPETRTMKNGMAVTRISVATTRRFKNSDGTKGEDTTWTKVVFFEKKAELIDRYFRKGSTILIEGRLTNRRWRDEQGEHMVTEVVGEDFTFTSQKDESSEKAPAEDVPF